MIYYPTYQIEGIELPKDVIIDEVVELVGLSGFIPTTFIANLALISKAGILRKELPVSDYLSSIKLLLSSVNIDKWLEDTLRLVKYLGTKYDLRVLETHAKTLEGFCTDNIDSSFNYVFDIQDVTEDTQKLLSISEEHMKQITKMDDEVIKILSLLSGLGGKVSNGRKTVSDYSSMRSYSEVTKLKSSVHAFPWFNYKFALKRFSLESETLSDKKADEVVVGYHLGTSSKSSSIKALLKLLGAILLKYPVDSTNITAYSFYANTYDKFEFGSREEIIDHFSQKLQLKLYPPNNSKSLQQLMFEHKGADIIFLPNTDSDCAIPLSYADNARVNIISFAGAKFNPRYANVCRQTKGDFITI